GALRAGLTRRVLTLTGRAFVPPVLVRLELVERLVEPLLIQFRLLERLPPLPMDEGEPRRLADIVERDLRAPVPRRDRSRRAMDDDVRAEAILLVRLAHASDRLQRLVGARHVREDPLRGCQLMSQRLLFRIPAGNEGGGVSFEGDPTLHHLHALRTSELV